MGLFDGLGNGLGSIFGGITGGLADSAGLNMPNYLSPEQQHALAQQIMQSQQQVNSNTPQQQALVQQMMAQANGQGGAAQQQLNQATSQNIKSGAGLIASQKGINPALAARIAAEQAGNMNQQAAGQSGMLQLQSQNQAYNALAGMNQQALNQGQYANQALNGSEAINQQNSQLQQKLVGGLLSGASSAVGSILGPKPAAGGAAPAAGAAMSKGGKVKGKAKKEGDSYSNDTVPAMLSPGEIVVPRSKAQDPAKAKAFIDALMKEGKDKKSPEGEASYGHVVQAHREIKKRLAEIEKKLSSKK